MVERLAQCAIHGGFTGPKPGITSWLGGKTKFPQTVVLNPMPKNSLHKIVQLYVSCTMLSQTIVCSHCAILS